MDGFLTILHSAKAQLTKQRKFLRHMAASGIRKKAWYLEDEERRKQLIKRFFGVYSFGELASNEGREKSAQNEGNKKAANDGGQENTHGIANRNNSETADGGDVVVTGNEFGAYKDLKDLRKKAIDYYRTHLQGTSVENAELGKIDIDDVGMVQFTTEGRQKVKANSANEETLFLIKYLPELIENAKEIEHKEATSEKHKKVGDSFYYLRTSYMREGKKIPLEITLKKLHTGDIHYYNHIVEPKVYKNEAPVSPRTESPDGANVSKADGASYASSIPQN